MKSTFLSLFVLVCLVTGSGIVQAAAQTQEPPSSPSADRDAIQGTVVSSTRNTLLIRSEDQQYHLFVFNQNTTKPRTLTAGARVQVASAPTDEANVRLATNVTELEPGSQGSQGTTSSARQVPPPTEVRDLERDIKRQARRWRLGARVGAALDPELFLFGVQSQMGPIFNRNVSFRPNAEFAFGEVTDLIALNLEAIYRLPISSSHGRWSAYVGAGPALTFIHQNFERGREIDFGNFDYDTGFNILTGLQFRKGTFFEMKTGLWSKPAPTLRLIFGYNF